MRHDRTDPDLGAGAIGGVLGAYPARGGVDVCMVDIVAEHARICSTEGLSIEGTVDTFRQVVPTVTPDKVTGTYGRIVLAVKAQTTEAAVTQLLPHLAADGFVLSAQNGLDTPLLSRVRELIHDIEEGRRQMSSETFGALSERISA
ncbi:ketopantoate reductase family protein [Rhizobium binxianense]